MLVEGEVFIEKLHGGKGHLRGYNQIRLHLAYGYAYARLREKPSTVLVFCCQFLETINRCPGLYIYDKLVVKFGFPYSPTPCLRPHNLAHVPTPAYAPKGNAYIHNDQCQPPDKSFCLSKNLCSFEKYAHRQIGSFPQRIGVKIISST